MMEENIAAKQLADSPHRRLNILTGEWVLVSANRSKRPWQGQSEAPEIEKKLEYDPECYLCPGNTRVSGDKNPDYQSVYSFTNDHSALLPNENPVSVEGKLLQAKTEYGRCKVICFSPRHDLTLAEMSPDDIQNVVVHWRGEYESLAKDENINYVQIFENKGSVMGCSNPHPHGQIWAQASIPREPEKELAKMLEYYESNSQTPMLMDYVALEVEREVRVVCKNNHFVAMVPYWATWPFELLILPRQQCASLSDFSTEQVADFANIIKEVTVRYDNLFSTSFPYSAGIHQAPVDGGEYPECTLHMHFYPPLLRSATVKKFMVGYEMLAESQRDLTPEQSAKLLRECSSVHYKA